MEVFALSCTTTATVAGSAEICAVLVVNSVNCVVTSGAVTLVIFAFAVVYFFVNFSVPSSDGDCTFQPLFAHVTPFANLQLTGSINVRVAVAVYKLLYPKVPPEGAQLMVPL